MDIIFFIPKSISPTGISFQEVYKECFSSENLGIGYLLAALQKNNIDCDVYDFTFDFRHEKEILGEALGQNPQIIGISVHQYSLLHAKHLIKTIREMNFDGIIVVGGLFTSLAPNLVFKTCPEIDHILLGECEYTIIEYVKCILNGRTNLNKIAGLLTKKSDLSSPFVLPKIDNLDNLPIPYRYGYKYLKEKNIPSIASSRGCPYGKCTFCSTAAYYKKNYGTNVWHYRNSKSIYNELKYLYTQYNCTYFVFVDETVFYRDCFPNRIPDALKRLAADGINMDFLCDCRASDVDTKKLLELKKYGLKRVFIGFETNNPKYLNFIKKGTTSSNNEIAVKILKDLEIEIIPGFIPFYPNATLESIKEDFRFMVETIGYNSIHKYVKRLLPEINTPFFKELVKQNNLYGEFPSYKYKFDDIRVQKLYDDLILLISEGGNSVDSIKLYNFVMNAE